MRNDPRTVALLVLTAAAVGSCGTFLPSFMPQDRASDGSAIAAQARSLLGRKYLQEATVAGKRFTLDCIGTVSAIYWGGAGIDLRDDFAKYSGNGVNRLWESLSASGSMRVDANPLPGDIVFWDNTWDANGDGKAGNDGHTHAGIVIQSDPDGTVHYIHASVTRGVTVAYLNLRHPGESRSPEGKTWNSPMYLGSGEGNASNPPAWRSGQLVSGLASADAVILRYRGKE